MITVQPQYAPAVQVGRRIRQIRESQGLSLRDLARRMGVSHQLLSRIELGLGNPTLGTLLHIAQALGCRVYDFLYDADEGPPGEARPIPRYPAQIYMNLQSLLAVMAHSRKVLEDTERQIAASLTAIGPA